MSDNAKGLLWALLASGLYAVVAAMAKIAALEFHVLQILFFRQMVVFASTLPMLLNSFPQSLVTRHPGLHALRLIGAFIALSCGIWAVAVLPLTTATTLGFAQVFFVALLALLFLREPVGVHRIAAIAVGFVGVTVAMRPGIDGLIDPRALIPLLAAFGAALAVIAVRKLSQTESTATLLVYQSLFIGLLSGLPLFWFWATPTPTETLFLLAMGVLAALGQWIGVRALRLGEASLIGSVQYTQLAYAALLGLVLFSELPDSHTLIGAGIIISAAAYIFHREALIHRPKEQA